MPTELRASCSPIFYAPSHRLPPAAEGSAAPSERGGGRAERGGSRAPKAPAAPKIKRPRGWNNWTASEKWQDDPIIDSGGWMSEYPVMGNLAELSLRQLLMLPHSLLQTRAGT